MTGAEPVRFWTSPAFSALPGLAAHGVTGRAGGVSAPPFDTLNLGLHVGDDNAAVRENRARAARAAGVSLDRMVCAEQVHGGRVHVVTAGDAGRGAGSLADAIAGADALVTDAPGLLLTLFFADCVPILLADPERRAVGAAHAGWRGLAAGVIGNTVAAMAGAFNSRPRNLLAAIGPGIGPCCYEVGEEVARHFDAAHRRPAGLAGRPRLDLPGAAAGVLVAAGLDPARIERCGACTSCETERFFSHRAAGGRTGRMAAVIALRPED